MYLPLTGKRMHVMTEMVHTKKRPSARGRYIIPCFFRHVKSLYKFKVYFKSKKYCIRGKSFVRIIYKGVFVCYNIPWITHVTVFGNKVVLFDCFTRRMLRDGDRKKYFFKVKGKNSHDDKGKEAGNYRHL